MAGDSLNAYKRDMIDANTNKGWPLTYGTDNQKGWQVQQTGNNALFPVTDYTKTAQWNQNITSDPILNFGSTSSDLGGVSTATNVLGWVMGGVSAATGLLGLGVGIASLCKKDDSNNAEKTETSNSALANATNEAKNCDKKTNKSKVGEVHSKLMENITKAGKRKDAKQGLVTSLEARIEKLSGEKEKLETELDNLKTTRADLDNQISDIDVQIDNLEKPEKQEGETDEAYQARLNTYNTKKKELEDQKAALKQQIKETCSDTIIKNKETAISNKDTDIEKATLDRDQAKIELTQIKNEIRDAKKEETRLKKLTGVDKEN